MTSLLAGAVLNTILDPIFIFVFHWGVSGAAFATVISQVVSAAIVIIYFIFMSRLRLRLKNLKLKVKLFIQTIYLGFSSCITQLANTFVQVVMNNSLVYYGNMSPVGGDIAISAMGIVMKTGWILISVLIGISIGVQPILGFNKGAEKYGRIKKAYTYAAVSATVISILGCIVVTQFPYAVISIFGSDNIKFTEFAVKCMRIFFTGVFVAGFQIVSANYFQATGQPLKAILLSMSRQVFLLIPLVLILPRFLGLDGVLFAGPFSDFGSGSITALFIFREFKILNNHIKLREAAES